MFVASRPAPPNPPRINYVTFMFKLSLYKMFPKEDLEIIKYNAVNLTTSKYYPHILLLRPVSLFL